MRERFSDGDETRSGRLPGGEIHRARQVKRPEACPAKTVQMRRCSQRPSNILGERTRRFPWSTTRGIAVHRLQ
jgi:hypothetical protein